MNTAPILPLTIEQFETGEFDPDRLDHEAHVYLGWLYVQAFGLSEAVRRFDSALKRLTEQLGIPDKYHATITWTFLLLINERYRDNEKWCAFYSRNSDLFCNSKAIVGRYYTDTLLFSDRARRHFVLPDRLAS
ncbi:MAG: hypothetical protein KJO95_00740 [Gammaproteobacteria bacterium]|nr:hypothetical protein [Gammaproteobacteria bacterium]MBU2678592.1 hypothetical protein [Gammaproteobacteria bacterium]NNC57558.1 hypothetical protein [Woeseiaceae bacterium]NNL52326.1 hypothetical protein [Woeseiaceae bacterium]